MIKKELLNFLCCPADKGEVVEESGKNSLQKMRQAISDAKKNSYYVD